MRQRLLSAWAKHAATTARERREKDIAEKDVATRQIAVAIRVQALVRAHRGKEGFSDRLRLRRSVVKIQKRWRGYKVRSTTRTMVRLE
ncbi:unnamed protein product [Sphacelaria rigidula]